MSIGVIYLVLALFFQCFYLLDSSDPLDSHHWPRFGRILDDTWATVQNSWRCLTSTGNWQLNSSRVIVDNIYVHAPCPIFYNWRNPCNWTLDGNNLKYDWQPEAHCGANLRTFDAPTMCSLMKGRGNMMVVGDSINELAVKSWVNKMLSGMGATTCPHEEDNLFAPRVRKIPGCGDFGIIFVRNEYVSLTKHLVVEGKNYQNQWVDRLVENNVSLLVLNRGAHYKPDGTFVQGINDTLRYLTTQHPNISVIWRNTPHGDLNFDQHLFSKPLTTPPVLEYEDTRWHYGKFKHQNALAETLIAKHYPRVLYLDVFTSAVLRQDGLHDPLHPCVPGFMDSWLQFIYNVLLLLAENHAKNFMKGR